MAPRFSLFTYLQTIDDEEAKIIVENEQLILIPDKTNKSGFWHVTQDMRNKIRKYRVNRFTDYEIKAHICFKSKVAAAIYISQHLGHSVCRSITTWYEDESESQILTNIRIPIGLSIPNVEINGQVYGGNGNVRRDTWRRKVIDLYHNSKAHTKVRNNEIRYKRGDTYVYRQRSSMEHTFNWTSDEFSLWAADTLERQNFKCAYSGQRLTASTVSLERLDETIGYSPENCILIDIHFQTGRQWTREKFQSIYELRIIDTYDEDEVRKTINWTRMNKSEQTRNAKQGHQHPTKLSIIFSILKGGCRGTTESRNKQGKNHQQSEITIEYLIELWEKQRGRCYYLDIPLNTEGDWKVSVERLDERKGYTKDNVVLVAQETQNAFAQWSKEFVKSVWDKSNSTSNPYQPCSTSSP
jgi:hypothetical protein